MARTAVCTHSLVWRGYTKRSARRGADAAESDVEFTASWTAARTDNEMMEMTKAGDCHRRRVQRERANYDNLRVVIDSSPLSENGEENDRALLVFV